MRNIKFTKEDHMKDLADILQEPPLENVHRVQQINTFRYTGSFGLISIALFIFAMFMSAKWRMNEIGLHAEADLIFAIEFFIAFAFMQYLFYRLSMSLFMRLLIHGTQKKRYIFEMLIPIVKRRWVSAVTFSCCFCRFFCCLSCPLQRLCC